jgi:hypothetical protein
VAEKLKLDEEKGLNPRMAICTRCGEDVGVVLLGAESNKYTCPECDALHYGRPDAKPKWKNLRVCQMCEHPFDSSWKKEAIEEWEKIPSPDPCDECVKKEAEAVQMVKEGGVYWRCTACGSEGVVRPGSELAKAVRASTGVSAPDPVGLEVGAEDCPLCEAEKGVTEEE